MKARVSILILTAVLSSGVSRAQTPLAKTGYEEAARLLVESAGNAPWLNEFKKTNGKVLGIILVSSDSLLLQQVRERLKENKKLKGIQISPEASDFTIQCSLEIRERLVKRRKEKTRIITLKIFNKQSSVWEGEFREPLVSAKG